MWCGPFLGAFMLRVCWGLCGLSLFILTSSHATILFSGQAGNSELTLGANLSVNG